MRRRSAEGETEAALIGEIARIERRLLAHRAGPAPAPAPGTVWQSDYQVFAAPLETRRAANPPPGTEICPGLKLFHDAGAGSVFSWSQTLGGLSRLAAPGLRLDCYDFAGTFLSLVAEIPPSALGAVGPGRVARFAVVAAPTRPLTCFLRLNLRGDTGHETLHETLVLARGTRGADFDLGGLEIGLGDCRAAWLDVILHAPRMCRIDIARLTLALAARDADVPDARR